MSREIESENHNLWDLADQIGQEIANMRDFSRVLALAGAGIDDAQGAAINTVAFELVKMAGRAAELTDELQDRLKTSENTETDDGNDEARGADDDAPCCQTSA